MEKIIVNRIRCKRCGDVIESMYTHDFKLCQCGAVGIDGGKEYLRREFDSEEDYQELSVVIEEVEIAKIRTQMEHMTTSEFTELLNQTENPDERELYSVVFNTILQQKQQEVIKANKF